MCHAAVQAIPLPAQELYSKWSTFTPQTMMSGGPYAHSSRQPANESGSIILLQPCATLLAEYTNALAKPKTGHSVRTSFNIQFKIGRSSPVAHRVGSPSRNRIHQSLTSIAPVRSCAHNPTIHPYRLQRSPPTRRAAQFTNPVSYLDGYTRFSPGSAVDPQPDYINPLHPRWHIRKRVFFLKKHHKIAIL